MIDYPFFRALGSLAVLKDLGEPIKAIVLDEKGETLRHQARAIAAQANIESLLDHLPHVYAAVVDRPFSDETLLPADNLHYLKGIIACTKAENGLWEKDDKKLVNRRNGGPFLGVFVGPIETKSVSSCYKTLIDSSYPSEYEANPSFELIAGAALRLIVPSPEPIALERAALLAVEGAKKIGQIMRLLKDAYRSLGNEGANWNVLWMLHVDQGLRNLEQSFAGVREVNFGQFVAESAFPAFLLPNPSDGLTYRRNHILERAIETNWKSSDLVATSLEGIKTQRERTNPQGSTLKIATLDWDLYDSTIHTKEFGGRNSPLLGFAMHTSRDKSAIELFTDLTEEEFFNPVVGAAELMEVLNVDESELATHGYIKNVEVIDQVFFENSGKHRKLISAEYVVLLPLISEAPTKKTLDSSSVTIEDLSRSRRGRVEIEVISRFLWPDGRVALRVRFDKTITGHNEFKHTPKVQSFGIFIPISDPMEGIVSRRARLNIVLLPSNGAGVIIVSSVGANFVDVIGQVEFDENGECISENDFEYALDMATDISVLVWSIEVPDSLMVDNSPRPISKLSKIRLNEEIKVDLSPVVVSVDDVSFTFSTTNEGEPVEDDFYSPLLAATEKGKVNPFANEADKEDLRGHFETLIFRNWKSWLQIGLNIGHIAVSANLNEEILDLKLDLQTRVLVSDEISSPGKLWPFTIGDHIEDELVESIELKSFLQAFDDLKLLDAVAASSKSGGTQWLSKVDVAEHLHRIARSGEDWQLLLDQYLISYANLISRADQVCGNFGKFWSRFPFSLSIWGESPRRLEGVMLSPFHPLRIAWLANAEDSLRKATVPPEVGRMFAGTISGWQFPMVTKSNTTIGSLMAIPTDNGIDSLFAGWSMVVHADIQQPEPLIVPRFAGNQNVPGVSANGLDSSAVDGAVRDFCKANPFVSTLVVDLAATSTSPRNPTIDFGLIERIKAWSNLRRSCGQISGGVRVYDSVNRLGEIPESVSEMSDPNESSPTALSWQKYDPRTLVPNANIRIMNDSGVKVEVESNSSVPRLGVMSKKPLRRYEVSSVTLGQVFSELNPMAPFEEPSPYICALNAAESRNSDDLSMASRIKLSIDGSHALLSGAEWTVIGESGLAPAALAELLQTTSTGPSRSTLWEWRPPFFDRLRNSSGSAVDRRPYLTVAQIPKIYSQKLKGLVSTLLGEDAKPIEVDRKIDRVFKTLGSRGIGLSSLMNGNQRSRTHQKGALGFSTVIEMVDRVASDEATRFLIPLDAANHYLNALAGLSQSPNGPRADLLAIELNDDNLIFVPIEIKFYALENPVVMLPDLSDAGVADALSQASAAWNLLQEVKRFWLSTRDDRCNKELMDNALVSLVDAAVRLTPMPSNLIDVVRSRMQKLINGELEVEVGLPVVAYLVATSHSQKSRHAQHFAPRAEVFIADPRTINAVVPGDECTLAHTRWRDVLNNAFESKSDKTHQKSVNKNDAKSVDLAPASAPRATPEPDAKIDVRPQIEESLIQPTIQLEMSETSPEPSANTDDEEFFVEQSEIAQSVLIKQSGVKFQVGEFAGTNEVTDFWPGNTALSSLNIGVLGDMGTGKTQFCLGWVNQIRRVSRAVQPEPVSGLILDYKHDYQKPEFLTAVGATVLQPRNLPLDLFGITGEKSMFAMNSKAQNFINIISMIFGGVGGQQRDRLREVIIQKISELPHSPTMREVLEAYKLANNRRADSVTEILNNFVYGEVFTSDPNDFQTIGQLLDGNVIVVDLRALDPDERTKKALVAVFLSSYFEHMISLTKWPFQQGVPQLRRLNSFLLVDEASSIMQYDYLPLHSILRQGREYGVAVVLSSQFLSDFVTAEANYAQPLRTWFVHRVPNVNKKALNDLGIVSANNDDAMRIPGLPIHHAFYSSFDCPGRFIKGYPFFEQVKLMNNDERVW